MRIGIAIKLTLSSIFIVILIVCVYAFITIRDTQASVDQETERIQRIQYEALDLLGAQTARTVSLPASSLMYDNDLAGLRGLLAPIVADRAAQKNYTALYAAIIAPDGHVWATVVNDRIDKLEMVGTTFFDRRTDTPQPVQIDGKYLEPFKAAKMGDIAAENLTHKIQIRGGKTSETGVRQYAAVIHPKDMETGAEEAQGYLVIGYDIDGLRAEIQAIRDKGALRKTEALNHAILLAIAAVIVGLFIAGLQGVLITRNIKKLSKAASQIASGDLSVRSHIRSSDEIGQLGQQFNAMADRVQILMRETEQKAMLEKEVDIARSIQTTLLPAEGYAQCGIVSLNGIFKPASVCGGDFWSYNRLPDGSTLLTIGDVTGHGVPSAMITACAKSALDTLLSVAGVGQFNLSQVVACLNSAICQTAKRTLFMTFQAVRVSADGRSAEIVNAGHNFPLLIHQGEVKGVVVRGDRLGDNPQTQYQSLRIPLNAGDMFLLYTDGLTEYQNAAGAEYGEKRLRKAIAPLAACDVTAAMQYLWNDFSSFCGNAPQNDDITLLFARIG